MRLGRDERERADAIVCKAGRRRVEVGTTHASSVRHLPPGIVLITSSPASAT
jgi:hypothetical protein